MSLAPMMAPVPTPRPTAAPAAPPGGMNEMDPMTLAAILAAIQVPQHERQPLPYTTFPEVPRAMNPAFTQMVMQALQSRPQPQNENLGALLRGGM